VLGVRFSVWHPATPDRAKAYHHRACDDHGTLPQKRWADVLLMDNPVEVAKNRGIERYEFSWVLESNSKSRGTLERLGTKIIGTYRKYDKTL
jgi:hypothetical protein